MDWQKPTHTFLGLIIGLVLGGMFEQSARLTLVALALLAVFICLALARRQKHPHSKP